MFVPLGSLYSMGTMYRVYTLYIYLTVSNNKYVGYLYIIIKKNKRLTFYNKI